jgi:hypothetical protein
MRRFSLILVGGARMHLVPLYSTQLILISALLIVGIPTTRLPTFLRLRSDPSPAARHQRLRIAFLLGLSPALALFLVGYLVKGLEILQFIGPVAALVSMAGYAVLVIKAVIRSEPTDD